MVLALRPPLHRPQRARRPYDGHDDFRSTQRPGIGDHDNDDDSRSVYNDHTTADDDHDHDDDSGDHHDDHAASPRPRSRHDHDERDHNYLDVDDDDVDDDVPPTTTTTLPKKTAIAWPAHGSAAIAIPRLCASRRPRINREFRSRV